MKTIFRIGLCLLLAALGPSARGQIVLAGLSPSHGLPGTTVTLSGTGFSSAATNTLSLNGIPAPIRSVNATNVVFSVPAGAQSGDVVLTVNGVPFLCIQAFRLDRPVRGSLALPPGVNPQGYLVASFGAISAPATNGWSFAATAPADTISFLWAFRGSNDPVFLAPVPTTTNQVVINANSTAQSLVFLSPLVATRDDALSQRILSSLAGSPQAAGLAGVINSLSADGVDFLGDARFARALTNTITALLQASPTPLKVRPHSLKAGTPANTALEDLTNGLPFIETPITLESTLLDVGPDSPEDYRLNLAAPDNASNPVDWVVEVFQLATGQFPMGRESVDQLFWNVTPLKLENEPFARGFVHATLKSAKIDILDRAVSYLLESTLFPPDQTDAAPNQFLFDKDIPGVYVSEAYSGNIWYGTGLFLQPNQSDLIERLNGDPEWDTALAANIAVAAIDLASVIVDVTKLTEGLPRANKILLAVENDVLQTIQIQQRNGGFTKELVYDVVKTATIAYTKEAIKQTLESLAEDTVKTLVKCASKTLLAVIDIPDKISTTEQSVERMGGIALPSVLAVERSIVIVGEPFYPVITRFYPPSGRGGDLVRIQGYNFPVDPTGVTVSFGAFSGTTSDTNAPPSVLLPAQVLSLTNNAIIVVAPTNWQSSFPNGLAYVCIQTTNSPLITSAASPPPYQQFQFKQNPQILDVYPKPVQSAGMLIISGTNFLPGAVLNNQVLVDGSAYNAAVQNADDQTITVTLSYLSPGPHSVQVQVAGEPSAPFNFTVQSPTPAAAGYSTGLGITVTKLDLSNIPDGQISLLEAVLIANGTLGRPIETHLPCESLPSSDPNSCPPQERESDHIAGLVNGQGGGPLSLDRVAIDPALSASNVVVSGVLPPFSSGDTYYFGNVTFDGGGAGQDALPLNGMTNVSVNNVTYQNYGGHGIHFLNGATANQISYVTIKNCAGEGVFFDTLAENNYLLAAMVSGSGKNGLHLSGSGVRLNFVDLPAFGQTNSLGTYNRNGAYGVLLNNGAQYNTVYPGSVQSNPLGGILVSGSDTAWNIIGRNQDVIPRFYDIYNNGGPGVQLGPGVHHTILHYLNPAGNNGDGILLQGPDCYSNQLDSIYTGMNYYDNGAKPNAPVPMPNMGSGIHLMSGAHNNLLGTLVYLDSFAGRSSITANRDDGILLEGPTTASNIVNRTHVGSIEPATFNPPYYFPNGQNGIHIRDGSHDNKLGDEESDLDLHIMASVNAGILIEDPGSDNNLIVGNQIGGNHEMEAIPPSGYNRFGVYLKNSAAGNIVGEPGHYMDIVLGYNEYQYRFANSIDYCTEAGVVLDNCGGSINALGSLTGPNVIQNNNIGEQDFGLSSPNAAGLLITNNAGGNLIGGALPETGNRIVNNLTAGVLMNRNVIGNPSLRNQFLNNYFNQETSPPPPVVDPLGAPPPGVGVLISGGSAGNVFGETISAPNLVQNHSAGVYIESSSGNLVRGNILATNLIAGVIIHAGSTNVIGDTARNTGNRIFANGQGGAGQGGIVIAGGGGNQLQSNLIGAPGLGNNNLGVLVTNSSGNLIGGQLAVSGNWIEGNNSHGLKISGAGSSQNQVIYNLIGVDQNNQPAANLGDGIHLDSGASANLIGGVFASVQAGNLLQGPAPNSISFNGGAGVSVTGPATIGNSILYNRITANTGPGIANNNGGNHLIPSPLQVSYDGSTLSGQVPDINAVPAGSLVQIFSDPGPAFPAGAQFLGEGTVLPGGTWSADIIGVPLFNQITVTSTHAVDGSTSEFGTGTAFNLGLNLQRAGTTAGQTAPAGAALLPVLSFTLAAVNADVRVGAITFTSGGQVSPATFVASASLYLDNNANGVVDAGDTPLGAPVAYAVGSNQVTLTLGGATIPANTSQQWLLAYSLSPSAAAGTQFQASITNAQAVTAFFVNPIGVVVPPSGTFPVTSPNFTVTGQTQGAPLLNGLARVAGGGFEFTLSGVGGDSYRVQASTDLSSWVDLTNITLTGPTFQFTDFPGTNFTKRFYRAVSP